MQKQIRMAKLVFSLSIVRYWVSVGHNGLDNWFRGYWRLLNIGKCEFTRVV